MNDLRNHVDSIANDLTTGEYDFEPECEGDERSAFDYIKDALDIEYTISSAGDYLGARILVAFGGPNIWINTRTNVVEGYWWQDTELATFTDTLGLHECCEELFACTS
jgi:hypothetical protein